MALHEDVVEVLGDPARFTAHLYGPKMEAITGPFILGVDDTPLYHHDHAAMDRAVTREDLPRLAGSMYETAQDLVAERRDDGEIDVVAQLAEPALDRVVADYFGTPGPDIATQSRWAHHVFHELFINVGNLPTVRERALADAAQWRSHLDALIDARKAQLQDGEDVPDDVLTRLLRYQDEGEPNFHDIAIRHNLLGNITGWIPTISNAFARIVDELLDRDQMEGAQKAARAGDRELVAAYCFEASRFHPQNFALLRHVPQDTTSPPAPSRGDGQGGFDGVRRDAVGDARRARDRRPRGVSHRPPVERLHALRLRAAHVLRPADRPRAAARAGQRAVRGTAPAARPRRRRQAALRGPVPVRPDGPLRRLTRSSGRARAARRVGDHAPYGARP